MVYHVWLKNGNAPARVLTESFGINGVSLPLKDLADHMLDEMTDSFALDQYDGERKDIKKMFMRILRNRMKSFKSEEESSPWKAKSAKDIEEQLITQLKNGKISNRLFMHLYKENKKVYDEDKKEWLATDWQPDVSNNIAIEKDVEANDLAVAHCESKSNQKGQKFCMNNRLEELVADFNEELNFLRSIFDDAEVEEIARHRTADYKCPALWSKWVEANSIGDSERPLIDLCFEWLPAHNNEAVAEGAPMTNMHTVFKGSCRDDQFFNVDNFAQKFPEFEFPESVDECVDILDKIFVTV